MSSEEALDAFYAALLDDDPHALYERAPCGYLSTTPDGTIIKVNQTFLTLTGYERSDLLGRRTFSELLTVGGRIYHETHYAPMLQMQGSARAIALDIVRADGERLPVLVNAVLERDDEGTPLIVRTAVFDATDRREYERELLRAKQKAEASEARAALLARTLQQALIPPAPPAINGLVVDGVYRPAGKGDEIGGDFYDVFALAPDDWLIALGDVCGKGVEAAVVATLARHTIRAAAVGRTRPSAILGALNQVLLREATERFCTVILVRLARSGLVWTATVASGGHPLPLLRRPGVPVATVGTPGSLLGVIDSAEFADVDIVLKSADILVLYTDGVTEGRGAGEFFGEERLWSTIDRLGDRPALAEAILHEVLVFQANNPIDDIAIISIRPAPDEVVAATAVTVV